LQLGEFFSFYIDNEKKNLRKEAAQTVDKACTSMDNCLQMLIATAGVWVQNKRSKTGTAGMWVQNNSPSIRNIVIKA
jgi:hypothetical protein